MNKEENENYHIISIGWDLSDKGYLKAVNVTLKDSQSNTKDLYFKYDGEGKQLDVPSGVTVEDYLNLTCLKIHEITENKDYELARSLFILTFFKDPYTGEDIQIDEEELDDKEDIPIDDKREICMENVNFKYLQEIKLDLVNGTTGKFKFLEQIQLNGESYAVLLPDGGNGTIVSIYKLKLENNGILRFLAVENKEVEKQVLNIYNNGEHNYLNKTTKSNSTKNNPLTSILIFLILTLISAIVLGFCWGLLPQEKFTDNLLILAIPCMITFLPSAIVTGIICGIFNIETFHVDRTTARIVELENQATHTKNPELRAQLRAQAEQLRLLRK